MLVFTVVHCASLRKEEQVSADYRNIKNKKNNNNTEIMITNTFATHTSLEPPINQKQSTPKVERVEDTHCVWLIIIAHERVDWMKYKKYIANININNTDSIRFYKQIMVLHTFPTHVPLTLKSSLPSTQTHSSPSSIITPSPSHHSFSPIISPQLSFFSLHIPFNNDDGVLYGRYTHRMLFASVTFSHCDELTIVSHTTEVSCMLKGKKKGINMTNRKRLTRYIYATYPIDTFP
jgi:hypothetical protein